MVQQPFRVWRNVRSRRCIYCKEYIFSSSVDPDSFSGSGAGSIQLTDSVVGLASFRSDLVIFCTNSIFRLVNISDSTNIAVVPVTRNVGCLDGQSIQEIGGDLIS